MWKGLSDEERKPWVEKSEQLKAAGGPGLGLQRKRTRSKNNTGIPGHAPIQPLPPAVQQVMSPASRFSSNRAWSVALSRVSIPCLYLVPAARAARFYYCIRAWPVLAC